MYIENSRKGCLRPKNLNIFLCLARQSQGQGGQLLMNAGVHSEPSIADTALSVWPATDSLTRQKNISQNTKLKSIAFVLLFSNLQLGGFRRENLEDKQ